MDSGEMEELKIENDKEGKFGDPAKNENEEKTIEDEFAYTKNSDFCSEIFKLEVRQIPRGMPYPAFKNFLKKNSISTRKLKLMGPKFKDEGAHAYLTFGSAKERDHAIEKLEGLHLKGGTLSVKQAEPMPDPLIKKRREDREQQEANKKIKGETFSQDDQFELLSQEEQEERVNKQVAAFWKVPYEEQIATKHLNLVKVLKKCFHELLKLGRLSGKTEDNSIKQSIDWFSRAKDNLEPVVPSPVISGYRNKFEFSIDSHNNLGFRLGSYRDNSVRVVQPPASCPLISPEIYGFLVLFAKYLKEKSQLKGFDPISREGHWKQMLIRSTRSMQFIVSIGLHRQQLSDQEIDNLSQEIVDFFKQELADEKMKNVSIYLQVLEDRSSRIGIVEPRLIHGTGNIFESLLGVEFRISPLSFFQVNAPAAELLYAKIIEMVTSNATDGKEKVVLDVCCGTGTIGLCLAALLAKAGQDSAHVVGIELNEDAIKDAQFNREHNQIKGVEFRCGRAELETSRVLESLPSQVEDVVAIIDPPRSGLPTALIKCIRNNHRISRVVYVSCDAAQAKQNLIDLCRPRSKAYRGLPFVPKRAVPLDLFPHSDGCELVLLFQRQSNEKTEDSSNNLQ